MQISLPIDENAELLVKTGQQVDFKTPFLKKRSESEIVINIATKLNIHPSKIFQYLNKLVGEKIEKEEVIALNKGLWKTQTVVSEYKGIIKEINHHEGTLIIKSLQGESNTTFSPIKGEIASFKKNEVVYKVGEGKEYLIKKIDVTVGSPVVYMNKQNFHDFSSLDLQDKILVIEHLSSYTQTKIEALGVKTFVTLVKPPETTSLPFAQLKQIEDFKKIQELKYPYCFINSSCSTIIFYATK